MDGDNLRDLRALARSPGELEKLQLLREYDPTSVDTRDVPDPYYGGPEGFSQVFDICLAACQGLLEHARARGFKPWT
jgi:protein-tyrosine phosphatase